MIISIPVLTLLLSLTAMPLIRLLSYYIILFNAIVVFYCVTNFTASCCFYSYLCVFQLLHIRVYVLNESMNINVLPYLLTYLLTYVFDDWPACLRVGNI